MKILFILALVSLYSLNYLLKYFFKLSVSFAALKSIKKTLFKEEKKVKAKKKVEPKSHEEIREEIENKNLRRFRLNKNNIKEMIREGFMNPLFAYNNEFYYQINLALENYMLWKFNGRNLKDINEVLNKILNDKTQLELCRMWIRTFEPYGEKKATRG